MRKTAMLPILYLYDSCNRQYTREEALREYPRRTKTVILGDKQYWTAYRKEYSLCVLGSKVFWKPLSTVSCTYKNGRIYGNITPFRPALIEVYKLDWIPSDTWVSLFLASRKDMWIRVLTGKITNPEMLCKAFSKKNFGGAYSYKNLKRFATGFYQASLWDLYYYTTNPDKALELFIGGREGLNSFSDALRYAKILNEKINPMWSMRRLHEEHQKQILKVDAKKLEGISATPIAKAFSKDGLSLILNERECYLEGQQMSNCVHRCYWSQIKVGTYLIARGVVLGEYVDVGIRLCIRNGEYSLRLDQVHTKYNGNPDSKVVAFCEEWIDKYRKDLLGVIKEIDNYGIINGTRVSMPRYLEEEDFPF